VNDDEAVKRQHLEAIDYGLLADAGQPLDAFEKRAPIADYNCLANHNMSADQLAARGIGPNDPRVRQILSQCAQTTPVARRHASAFRPWRALARDAGSRLLSRMDLTEP
jgi:hypothetical protein